MRYSSSAHTRFYHRFHVVWVTKYRYAVLAYSGVIRPPVPIASGHPYRFDPAGDSGASGHPQIHPV